MSTRECWNESAPHEADWVAILFLGAGPQPEYEQIIGNVTWSGNSSGDTGVVVTSAVQITDTIYNVIGGHGAPGLDGADGIPGGEDGGNGTAGGKGGSAGGDGGRGPPTGWST